MVIEEENLLGDPLYAGLDKNFKELELPIFPFFSPLSGMEISVL